MVSMKGFIALLVLAAIHLFANRANRLGWLWHGRFLSFAAGISFAYVFVDLLPAIQKGQPILKRTFDPFLPYFDRHAYVVALFGVLFYYGLHTSVKGPSKKNFWLGLVGYMLFNFFLGTSLADSSNPEIQPLSLFVIAFGMHYFIADHNLSMRDPDLYDHRARWGLASALFLGYVVGRFSSLPDAVVALTISFIAGGVLLNSLRYELPKRTHLGFSSFVLGALLYTGVVLSIGHS